MGRYFLHLTYLGHTSFRLWRILACKILGTAICSIFLSYFVITTLWNQSQEPWEVRPNLSQYSRGQKPPKEPLCKLPFLPLDSLEVTKHLKKVDPIRCHNEGAEEKRSDDWLYINGSHALLTLQAKEKYGSIMCQFANVERINDLSTRISEKAVKGQAYEFKNSDFVHANCSSAEHKWDSFLSAPRSNVQIQKKSSQQAKNMHGRLNVLIYGHDSLSRNSFIRKLPETFSYLNEKLNGITLKGYNIVGDGTPQALIPILTGLTELELPECRRRFSTAQYVNVYPFIWKDYEARGYLTGYLEDCPGIGTFQYRLKGFKDPPTHFYMRPYFLEAEKYYANYPKYCIGSIPRHKIMMNYVKNILQYKKELPKFLFSFHSELSHSDFNSIQGLDLDFKQFLEELNHTNALNNTILIIMSDHGNRFSEIRQTQQGKQEERLPMFMFVFPPWFKSKYSAAYNNFLKNSHLLSTPFDIHATLVDILDLPKLTEDDFLKPNEKTERQMSLFRPVPSSRTCKDAKIDPHWCACLQWHILDVGLPIVQDVANTFVKYINDYITDQTSTSPSLCATLKLHKILWAASLRPTDEMIQFKNSLDVDGLLPDLTDNMTISKPTIQLQLETIPGHGQFEVSVTHDIHSQKIQIQESEISRINKFGSQAHCIEHNLEHLRKYCFCNSPSDLE